jgi:hypothetical protein
MIGVLVTDLLLSNIPLSGFKISSLWGVTTFIVLSIIFLVGQYIILGLVINKSKSIARKSAIINRLDKIILIIQSVLAGIILILITLMLITYPILFHSPSKCTNNKLQLSCSGARNTFVALLFVVCWL